MCLQAGKEATVPSPAQREPGAQDATPPVAAPTGQNVTLQMDRAAAQPAGRGRAATNHVRSEIIHQITHFSHHRLKFK